MALAIMKEDNAIDVEYDGFLRKGKIKGRTTTAIGGGTNAISERQIAWLLVIIAVIALAGVVLSIR